MAISNRGLADGFLGGLSAGNQIINSKHQRGLADAQEARSKEQHDVIMRNENRKEAEYKNKEYYNQMLSGNVTPEALKFWDENPQYDPAFIASDDTSSSIDTFDDLMNPETPTRMNDPQAIAAMNQLFNYEINKGSPGNKKVTQLTQSTLVEPNADPSTLLVSLDVDGQRKPMTEGRGVSDGNSNVMQVPVKSLIKKASGYKAMNHFLRSDKGKAALKKYGQARGYEPEPEWSELQFKPGMGHYIKNLKTGEVKSINADKTLYSKGKEDKNSMAGMKGWKQPVYEKDADGYTVKTGEKQLWINDEGVVFENYNGKRTPQQDIPFLEASYAISQQYGVDIENDPKAKKLFDRGNIGALRKYIDDMLNQSKQPAPPKETKATDRPRPRPKQEPKPDKSDKGNSEFGGVGNIGGLASSVKGNKQTDEEPKGKSFMGKLKDGLLPQEARTFISDIAGTVGDNISPEMMKIESEFRKKYPGKHENEKALFDQYLKDNHPDVYKRIAERKGRLENPFPSQSKSNDNASKNDKLRSQFADHK